MHARTHTHTHTHHLIHLHTHVCTQIRNTVSDWGHNSEWMKKDELKEQAVIKEEQVWDEISTVKLNLYFCCRYGPKLRLNFMATLTFMSTASPTYQTAMDTATQTLTYPPHCDWNWRCLWSRIMSVLWQIWIVCAFIIDVQCQRQMMMGKILTVLNVQDVSWSFITFAC